jgi:hypothetical protein
MPGNSIQISVALICKVLTCKRKTCLGET